MHRRGQLQNAADAVFQGDALMPVVEILRVARRADRAHDRRNVPRQARRVGPELGRVLRTRRRHPAGADRRDRHDVVAAGMHDRRRQRPDPGGRRLGELCGPDPAIGLDAAHDYRILYEARAEPALSTRNTLVISYNVNSVGVNTGCQPMASYTNTVTLPRFVTVPLAEATKELKVVDPAPQSPPAPASVARALAVMNASRSRM